MRITLILLLLVGAPAFGALQIEELYSRARTAIQALKPGDSTSAAELVSIYEIFRHAKQDAVDTNLIIQESTQNIELIAKLRRELKEKLKQLDQINGISPEIEKAARDFMRGARYIEDMIGEAATSYKRLAKEEKVNRAFSGKSPELISFLNPDGFEFKSGDVIVMRGSAPTSAYIARVMENDSQFSHAAFVYINPSNGQKHIVEALIETGLIVSDFEKSMNHGVGRMILLRYNGADSQLAHRAAEAMYQIAKAKADSGAAFPYSFDMHLTDGPNYFCSKVIREGFRLASKGEVLLPRHLSKFETIKNKSFLDAIGVKASRTFAPGDLEVDPSFDWVAEWRDFRMTPILRIKDLILTQINKWMEEEGLVLVPNYYIHALATIAKLGSQNPVASKYLPKIPSEMSVETIKATLMLDKTTEYLEKRVLAALPPSATPNEILQFLESLKTSEMKAKNHLKFLRINDESCKGFLNSFWN